MNRCTIIGLSVCLLLCANAPSVYAQTTVNTNIFGAHLTQTSDLENVTPYINDQGQTWGWVTIVLSKRDLDRQKWQDFFDRCREQHVIPLVRLATQPNNSVWEKPTLQDIRDFAHFLASLNWPTQQQYLIFFNEPNHASEWGGIVDPVEYAKLYLEAQTILKEKNPSFILLLAGADLASPHTPPDYFSADKFYSQLLAVPDLLVNSEGLASHSYPNLGFIGKPTDNTIHSIRGYQWEHSLFSSRGVNIPIFITETGWPHREGVRPDNAYYTANTSAQFLLEAYKLWQVDPRVKAVTPFIFNYPQEPFDHFSWTDQEGAVYKEYTQFCSLAKPKWKPPQVQGYEKTAVHLPLFILPGHSYEGKITLTNTGQSILGEEPFCLSPESSQEITLSTLCLPNGILVTPKHQYEFKFTFQLQPNLTNKTLYISWQGIVPITIKPLFASDDLLVYRKETGVLEKIQSFLDTIF